MVATLIEIFGKVDSAEFLTMGRRSVFERDK